MKLDERRYQLYPRVELKGSAIVHNLKTVVVVEILNLSEGGILLSKEEGSSLFEIGKIVLMTLTSSHFPEPIHALGTVVRHQTKERTENVGIEFCRLSKNTRLQLKTSIQEVQLESSLNESRTLC